MDNQKKPFDEFVITEKRMMALSYSKGVLYPGVLKLYQNIRTGYEKILLNCNQLAEHQEVEHHLWKLHYKLIDEFRRRIRQQASNVEDIKSEPQSDSFHSESISDEALEGFTSFLSEAAGFYRMLIMKLRKSCGLPPEIFLSVKDSSLYSIQSTKLHACQYTCHRLLICLGDLARYTETVKKPDAREWAIASSYYLEASRTLPESANPHNQLALLATYVGDAFLALYHCIRSLAVKEPFPDAWRNLQLLFEENRYEKLPSLSSQMTLDLLNPSKRSYLQNTCHKENSSPHHETSELLENVCSAKLDLWPILVRTISFFFLKTSFDEFPSTLASAMHSLEALLALEDAELTAALESYQQMGSSKQGPFRAIQLVSILIFIVYSLTESQETEESTDSDDRITLAFAATFICMGRLTERCLRGNCTDTCPLLPAVLVFLEWLVGALDRAGAHGADERVINAMSYYFGALAELLDRINQKGNITAPDDIALWEDHELRGFHLLAREHERLDFTTDLEGIRNFKSGNQSRLHRTCHAATRIIDSYGKVRTLSNSMKTTRSSDQGSVEIAESVSTYEVKEPDEPLSEEIECYPGPETRPTTEEEEVILFKPITRRNSAPPYMSKHINDHVSPEIQHAASLSTAQSTAYTDSFSFFSIMSSSGNNKSFRQKDPLLKDSTTHLTGPPSLSAWFGSSNIEREKGQNEFSKQKLSPIEEIASTSFSDLYIGGALDTEVSMGHMSTIIHSPSPHATPIPSAPLLPDDAVWLKSSIGHEADGILGAPPISGFTSHSTTRGPIGHLGHVDGYPPFHGMSSSEWLYHYRNNQNVARNHISPLHLNSPANIQSNKLYGLYDQWGCHFESNPMLRWGSPHLYPNSCLLYGAEEQNREELFLGGYQRPFQHACGVGMEMSAEQPSLLQYLKDRERQLQPGLQLRNPNFIGK